MTRVPITGIGIVAPGAIGIAAFRALLGSGETAIREVERFDTAGLRAHKAALVTGFVPKEFIAPMKMRRMNMLSRLGVSAAKMAFDDAGVAPEAGTGVAIGTSFGPVQTSVDYMQEYVAKGAALAPPQLFAESVANAPGSHIAIEHNLRGFNLTVTQRESSALSAAMYAAAQIAKRTVPAALIGGVEEVNEMIFSVLDRVGSLSAEGMRPFDARHDGMSIGEGSAILLAGGNGTKCYGWLAGFGIARDVTASISDWGDDHEAVVAAMRAAIDDAELSVADIDAVYASANGIPRADRLEARALAALFGANVPPVVAVKGVFGEYSGGGSIQLVAAMLAMEEQSLHASYGFEQPDAEVRFEVTRERRNLPLRHILINSISAGGGIVSAVISREAS
ncbi:MAG TPA: beta-ketoacyl synthase N-terminal-like domain-containing protein [Thermoanaerobaculia bacterium]|jgi:3-oxoacyl-(acyl-carrier-protein) synthase